MANLQTMNKEQLIEAGNELQLELTMEMSKNEMVSAIEQAQGDNGDDGNGDKDTGDNTPSEPTVGDAERNALEIELRKYVKRSGGYRKDLPADQKKRAEEILKKLNRKDPVWSV